MKGWAWETGGSRVVDDRQICRISGTPSKGLRKPSDHIRGRAWEAQRNVYVCPELLSPRTMEEALYLRNVQHRLKRESCSLSRQAVACRETACAVACSRAGLGRLAGLVDDHHDRRRDYGGPSVLFVGCLMWVLSQWRAFLRAPHRAFPHPQQEATRQWRAGMRPRIGPLFAASCRAAVVLTPSCNCWLLAAGCCSCSTGTG